MSKPRYITYNGECRSTKEWSRITGIPPRLIWTRLRRGWDVGRALTELPKRTRHYRPTLKKQKYTAAYNGKTLSLTPVKWESVTGVSSNLIRSRIKKGWSVQDAVTTPPGERTSHIVEHNGEKHNITEWSRITGVPSYVISTRLRKGWTAERALSTPSRCIKMPKKKKGIRIYEYHGEAHNLHEWEKKMGVKRGTLSDRMSRGWSFEKAIETEVRKMDTLRSSEERARRRSEQAERALKITYNGETKTISEWAEISGIPYNVLYGRYRMKWSPEEMFIPVWECREPQREGQ